MPLMLHFRTNNYKHRLLSTLLRGEREEQERIRLFSLLWLAGVPATQDRFFGRGEVISFTAYTSNRSFRG